MIQLMSISRIRLLKAALYLIIGASLLVLNGCVRSYRVEIQQGNVISAEQIEKITPGTSRNEVRFILGTPLIEDPFHAERWDYFYSLDPAKGELVTKYRLSVWFENDQVLRTVVEGAGLPGAIEPDLEEDSPGFFSQLWDKVTPSDD
ncbi:MAG: outer membrane protein assembly factor BamE [Proteobacteria bacterium]|jgi:outer membrane protein assembly factor BamE|nr:outer membrane protein assembly factor BamE [Pseudomonadota bacterium]|tara:strand:+ start:330 stop:770 length:441 start_codon:yes stop_codon:yes gene_type:complete